MKKNGEILFLILSVLLIVVGIRFMVNGYAIIGQDAYSLTGQAVGGEYIIFIGLIFFIVYYNTVSPFSWLKKWKNRKRKK